MCWQLLCRIFLTLGILVLTGIVQGQIFDKSRPDPYRAVFVATDDFDSTYLIVLENTFRMPLPDSLKLVKDNGVGKSAHAITKGTGFGTELITLLVKKLEGKLSMDTHEGTTVNINFKYTKV